MDQLPSKQRSPDQSELTHTQQCPAKSISVSVQFIGLFQASCTKILQRVKAEQRIVHCFTVNKSTSGGGI